MHNLSQILFPCFSYFVLTPPCELFSKNRKNRETKFGKDYAFFLFLKIILHAVSETISENINTDYNFICGFCLHEHMDRCDLDTLLKNSTKISNSIALNSASSPPEFAHPLCHFSKWRNNCCNSGGGVASARKLATPVAQLTCSPAACTMGAMSRFIPSVLDL